MEFALEYKVKKKNGKFPFHYKLAQSIMETHANVEGISDHGIVITDLNLKVKPTRKVLVIRKGKSIFIRKRTVNY